MKSWYKALLHGVVKNKPWVSVTGIQWHSVLHYKHQKLQWANLRHGFDSLLSEAKPPTDGLASPDHDLLGLWRADMRGGFSPTVLSPPVSFE